jgi:hypothetical protein
LSDKPAKGDKKAAAAAASSSEPKADKKAAAPKAEKKAAAEKKEKAPREPVDISGSLLPALMSGLQTFVAYIDAQMAPKGDKEAPKTPSLAAQLASMRRSPNVDALNEAQRGQVLNILVGTTVLLAQRLASLVASLPAKSETDDGKSSGLNPDQRRQLRTLRPALHLLVAAAAHVRQPRAEAAVVNVDAAVIQVAAQSFASLSRSLNLLDFLSLSASMSFSLQRLNARLKVVAAAAADQKLNEVASQDADALSSLLSDKQLRIILGQYNRLPKRAAIRDQLGMLHSNKMLS